MVDTPLHSHLACLYFQYENHNEIKQPLPCTHLGSVWLEHVFNQRLLDWQDLWELGLDLQGKWWVHNVYMDWENAPCHTKTCANRNYPF